MHITTRLGIDIVDGVDAVSAYPAADAQAKGILDNAATYFEGTLAGRPAPGSVEKGRLYHVTDAGTENLSWSDGDEWLPLGLLPATASASIGAVSGQMLITTGAAPVTITAPSNFDGALFGVINRTTASTTVSGSNIQGFGLSGASSFTLTGAGTYTLLFGDGTNWYVAGGQQGVATYQSGTAASRPAANAVPAGTFYYGTDNTTWSLSNGTTWGTALVAGAWSTLSLAGGVSSNGAYTPSARLEGDVVRLKGLLAVFGGSPPSTWATVPAGLRPGGTIYLSATAYNSNSGTYGAGQVTIASNGALGPVATGVTQWGSAGAQVALDGLTYTLS